MSSTILVINEKKKRAVQGLIDRERPHLKIIHCENITDAEYHILADDIDIILMALHESAQEELLFIRHTLEKHPAKKVILVSNQDELNNILTALTELPSGQLLSILASNTPSSDTARYAYKFTSVARHSPSALFDFKGLIGESPEMQKLKKLLVKIAPTGTTILIQGESGTGKEVIARAIHAQSARSNEVFIPVDCAAINDSIIESELFGHSKGAFTGADRNTLGMIRSADKGTLFLDEIAELPLSMQAKLLRTLQERAVKPVGETKIYPVNIRIIVATNCNLTEAVKKGTFRQDLYYRLNAITIFVPPLREQRFDIPLLCNYFIDKLVKEGYPAKQFSESAINALVAFDWPGNIRELENVVRGAITISHGDIMERDSLSFDHYQATDDESVDTQQPASIASHEKDAIRKALNQTTGNRRAAAKLLGISEATLYRRLKNYNL